MKISWTHPVRKQAVLQTVREARNILHTIKGRKEERLNGPVTSCAGIAI